MFTGWPLEYALQEVYSIHPAVIPFLGIGTERQGLKGRKPEDLIFQEICQEGT